ncbi:RBBP9/YdeN family alpha/beta hydrolase [Ottowia thiooxydans]|uniref:RBBP9/YdeN family alpha/beta hydrolase n=1 Tax=Ottowia thiooxydans TaxID=219182 RepID=UPI0004190509|nr:alpha/beta hydrolase [Ottowia thiooxydans]
MSSPTVVIVPGWHNSGPRHWQTLWYHRLPRAVRVEQADWYRPARQAWVKQLAHTIEEVEGPVLIAAHSLGCITTAHLPPSLHDRIHGALLVAPADPENRAALTDFAPVPRERLPFPSIVVGSSNDPYCPVAKTCQYAQAWGSRLVLLDKSGHINVESGHGEWPFGITLLKSLGAEPLLRQAA